MNNNNGKDDHGSLKSGSDFGSSFQNESWNLKFGARLKKRRENLGISQVGLAKKIGSNKSTIQNYEAGSSPKGDFLVLIAKELKCTTGWLLMGEGPEPEPAPLQDSVSVSDELTSTLRGPDGRIKDESVVRAPEEEYAPHGGWKPGAHLEGEDWTLMGKAHNILSSDTPYRIALVTNIEAFHHALQSEKKHMETEQKLRDTEKTLNDQAVKIEVQDRKIEALNKEHHLLMDRLAALEEKEIKSSTGES